MTNLEDIHRIIMRTIKVHKPFLDTLHDNLGDATMAIFSVNLKLPIFFATLPLGLTDRNRGIVEIPDVNPDGYYE